MKKLILILLVLIQSLQAAPAWYYGKITRIWHHSADGFIITLDSTAVDDCSNRYVYISANHLGKEQKDALYSMALSSFHANSKLGIVIDKAKNVNGLCYAMSMDIIK